MKTYFKISALAVLLMVGLSACLDEKSDELKYMGVWRVDHYYVDGSDETTWYLSTYRDHLIYIEANHSFSERWVDDAGPYVVYGTWSLSDDRHEINLHDNTNGTRTYHLKYTFFLSYKSDGREWIFRKI